MFQYYFQYHFHPAFFFLVLNKLGMAISTFILESRGLA